MSRDLNSITQRDMDFLKLGQEARKKIKTRKEWLAFVRYMKVYYPTKK